MNIQTVHLVPQVARNLWSLDPGPGKEHVIHDVTAWQASRGTLTVRTNHGVPCPYATFAEGHVGFARPTGGATACSQAVPCGFTAWQAGRATLAEGHAERSKPWR